MRYCTNCSNFTNGCSASPSPKKAQLPQDHAQAVATAAQQRVEAIAIAYFNPVPAYSGQRDRSFRSIVTAAHELMLRG